MKMKKYMIGILCMAFVILCILPLQSYADTNLDEIMTSMGGVRSPSPGSASGIGKAINIGIKLIQVAGTGISVVSITILGIKYMLATASERADLKKQAVPIIIGCVILFASVNIAGIIADVGDSFNQ